MLDDGEVWLGLEWRAEHASAFHDCGPREAVFPEQAVDFLKGGVFAFTGNGTSIDFDAATLRYDVGLTASLDDSDVDGWMTK